MKRFSALFTLIAALFLFQGDLRAQSILITLDPVSGPDSLHMKCIPALGDSVTVLADQLYSEGTVVTSMWADSSKNAYMIELNGVLRLFKIVRRCSSNFKWMRIEGHDITAQSVFILPDDVALPEPSQDFLKKEA